MRHRCIFSLAFSWTSLIGFAQEQLPHQQPSVNAAGVSRKARPDRPPASLRQDVNRVLIPVSVTDPTDHQVQGLTKKDFRLFQDGVPQVVTEFFIDETPASVGIVLDSSNSMRTKIDHAARAIKSFLQMSLPGDEFFLITVQDQPELAHAFTADADAIYYDAAAVRPRGWTALYDGIYLGIHNLKRSARESRALLVLSDGGDNNSRYTESEIRRLVAESDVRIFTLSILDRSPSLEKLAEESGGRGFRAHKLEELSDKAIGLSALVHGQYVLGFSPRVENRDGKRHVVKVEVNQPSDGTRLRATWRHGYYSPVQ